MDRLEDSPTGVGGNECRREDRWGGLGVGTSKTWPEWTNITQSVIRSGKKSITATGSLPKSVNRVCFTTFLFPARPTVVPISPLGLPVTTGPLLSLGSSVTEVPWCHRGPPSSLSSPVFRLRPVHVRKVLSVTRLP